MEYAAQQEGPNKRQRDTSRETERMDHRRERGREKRESKKTIKPKQNKSLHTNTQEGLDLYIRLSKKPHKH